MIVLLFYVRVKWELLFVSEKSRIFSLEEVKTSAVRQLESTT